MTGRSGSIEFHEAEKVAEFYVEMSGVPEYNLLIWFEETRYWKIPEQEIITNEYRKTMKDQIIKELERRKLKSDINVQN